MANTPFLPGEPLSMPKYLTSNGILALAIEQTASTRRKNLKK